LEVLPVTGTAAAQGVEIRESVGSDHHGLAVEREAPSVEPSCGAHFQGSVPGGEYWELHVPVEASVSLSGVKLKQAQVGLIAWLQANAANLPVTRFGNRYPYSAQHHAAPGVPFRFALYRWSVPQLPQCKLSGAFWWREFIAGDLERARCARLARVCDDKFGELARWKRDEGARSVLVLEENDISCTNHQLVAEAMARVEAGRPNIPDEIFLVRTAATISESRLPVNGPATV
jgi:hypothetical protein